jgi:hypothetical protein
VYNFGSGSSLLGMVVLCIMFFIKQFHTKMHGPYNIKLSFPDYLRAKNNTKLLRCTQIFSLKRCAKEVLNVHAAISGTVGVGVSQQEGSRYI